MTMSDHRFGQPPATGRRAAVKRAAPYLATGALVVLLLVIGLLRSPNASPSAQPIPEASSGARAASGDIDAATSTGTGSGTGDTRSGSETGNGSSSGTTRPAPGPTTTEPAPATTDAAKPLATKVVDWIRDLGLTGGGGSYQEAFLGSLSEGACDELLRSVAAADPAEVDARTRTLYRSAAQACLGAFDGRAELWVAAQAGLARVPVDQLGCIDRSVHQLTRRLLDLHRDEPRTVLRRGGRGTAGTVNCPRVIAVEPGHGRVGAEVVIVGDHLPDPAVIHFGFETAITVPTSGGRRAVLTVPPPGRNDFPDATVWVDGWPFESTHAITFTYDDPAPAASGT